MRASHFNCPIGLWLALIVLACSFSCERSVAAATADRSLWLFEQFSAAPVPTPFESSRYQVGLAATQFSDSLSSQVAVNLDARSFELTGFYSKRSYLELSDRGRAVHQALLGLDQSFLVEVARYVATARQHYGRLGIGYFKFPGSSYEGVRAALSTGILPTELIPWELKLRLAVFFPFEGNDKLLVFELQSGRLWGTAKLGGNVSWSYRPREVAGLGVYEYMLVSMGPYWETTFGPSRLNVGAKWRIWLDRDLFTAQGQTVTANPNEFTGIPDLNLVWTFEF